MRKRKLDVLILLLYCIPYVFLGMLGDYAANTLLLYILMVAALLALLLYCMKTERMPIAIIGNVLSVLSSGLFTRGFATESWNYYFKAYSPMVRTMQFCGILLVIQAVVLWIIKAYKKEEEKDAS